MHLYRNIIKSGCTAFLLILLTAFLPVAGYSEETADAAPDDAQLVDTADTAPDDVEQVEAAAHLVLVSYQVSGKKRTGHGVIVQIEEKPYILTNQHLILGADKITFTSAGGKKLTPRSIELSKSRDLARLALPEDMGPGLPLSSKAAMNTPIAVLVSDDRDSEENNVEENRGNIIGVGSTKLEISVAFDASENGAPVLNDAEEVVGVTTHSREFSFSIHKTGSRFHESTRYFCSRMGKADWKAVNWKAYNNKFGKAFRHHDIFYEELTELVENWKEARVSATKADTLANQCRTHARQLRKLEDQQGLTDFLQNDFMDKADFFEGIGESLANYADYVR